MRVSAMTPRPKGPMRGRSRGPPPEEARPSVPAFRFPVLARFSVPEAVKGRGAVTGPHPVPLDAFDKNGFAALPDPDILAAFRRA